MLVMENHSTKQNEQGKEFSTPSLYDLVKNGENTTTLGYLTNINNTINGIKYYIEKDSQENKDPNAFINRRA